MPRPKVLATRPSAEGPLHDGIISFLTHDREFIAAVRSYVHLLAHPPASSQSAEADHSPKKRSTASKRMRRKVPANAANWDIPFPFADGEAPPGYLESWALKKVRSLMNQMLAALHRAVFKVELLRRARSRVDLTIDPNETPAEITSRASEATAPVNSWLKSTLRNESVALGLDTAPLSQRISDILDNFTPEDQRVDQPITVSQTVEALKVSINSAQTKYQQHQPLPSPGPTVHLPPSPAPAAQSSSLDGMSSSDMLWSNSAFSSATSIVTPNSLSGMSSSGISPSLPTLGLSPSDTTLPFVLDPQLAFDSSFGQIPDFTFGPDATPEDEASVMDWLFTSLNGTDFSTDSSLTGTATATPSSLSNVPLPNPPLPSSSNWGSLVFSPPPPTNIPFIPTPDAPPAPAPQRSPFQASRTPTKKTVAKSTPSARPRKRQLTRPEIVELQRQTTSLAMAARPPGGEERVVNVGEVKARAEQVRQKLARELADVERELWALDIEREVLLGVQASIEPR